MVDDLKRPILRRNRGGGVPCAGNRRPLFHVGGVVSGLFILFSVVLFMQSRFYLAAGYGPFAILGIPEFSSSSPSDLEGEVAVITRLDRLAARPEVASHASAPSLSPLDRRLVERVPMGVLPRVGPDGERPVDIYARSFIRSPGRLAELPMIAIVVGGMGIDAPTTLRAVEILPSEVTLAFAPYGDDLQNRVNRALKTGHEVLLQLPMEPFGYPDKDPGPHTLLTSVHANDNLDRMHWLMARFTGYFGVINYMGAKFTSSGEDLAPVLQEIGLRGLAFIDEGSSPRSRIVTLAAGAGVPSYRSDLVIDARPDEKEIQEALRQLEDIALRRGYAMGSATAFPAVISQLASWSSGLSERGFLLVPASVFVRFGEDN